MKVTYLEVETEIIRYFWKRMKLIKRKRKEQLMCLEVKTQQTRFDLYIQRLQSTNYVFRG